MQGKTHALGGLLLAEAVLMVLKRPEFGNGESIFLIAGAVGGLLPDIDHPYSKISKTNAMTQMISAGVGAVTKHRGFTHTVLFAAIMALIPAALFFWKGLIYCDMFALGLFVGMISHLMLDSLNPTGIMWLYPFKKKKYHIMKIKTGSSREDVFRYIETAGLVAMSYCIDRSYQIVDKLTNVIK